MSESIHRDTGVDAPRGDKSSSEWPGAQHAGSFRYFVDGGRWDWSETASQIHGYRRADVEPSLDLLLQHTHFEDRTRMVAQFRRVMLGEALQTRYRIFVNSGDLRWIVLAADALTDGSGAVLGAFGYFIDVTGAVQGGVTDAVSEIASSRAVIEQAKGLLIASYGVSADDAFTLLVQRSQAMNVKVKDIATQLVDALSEGSARLRMTVDAALRTVSASG